MATSIKPSATPNSGRKKKTPDGSKSSSSSWGGIFAPLMKRWLEPPSILVSTRYGEPNQPGRPGPVLSIVVERAPTISQRQKQRQYHKYRGGDSRGKGQGPTNDPNTLIAPELLGLLVATPCVVERYRLSGAPAKRAALPESVGALCHAQVAGIGRVLVTATQSGRVYILKTDRLDSMIILDTNCTNQVIFKQLAGGPQVLPAVSVAFSKTYAQASKDKMNQRDRRRSASLSRQVVDSIRQTRRRLSHPDQAHPQALHKSDGIPYEGSVLSSFSHADSQSSTASNITSPRKSSSPPSTTAVELCGPPSPRHDSNATPRVQRESVTLARGRACSSPRPRFSVSSITASHSSFVPHLTVHTNDKGREGSSSRSPEVHRSEDDILWRHDVSEDDECYDSGRHGDTSTNPNIGGARGRNIYSQIPPSHNQLSPPSRGGSSASSSLHDGEEPAASAPLQQVDDAITPSALSAVTVRLTFGAIAQTVIAGNESGQIFIWAVPSGRLLHAEPYPTEAARIFRQQSKDDVDSVANYHEKRSVEGESPYCDGTKGLHRRPSVEGCDRQYVGALCVPDSQKGTLWVGYGDGLIAIYDLDTMNLKRLLCSPCFAAVLSLTYSLSMNIVVGLCGQQYVAVWGLHDFNVKRVYPTNLITCGTPLSCIQLVEVETRHLPSPSCIMFAGCIDGSLTVRRLFWKSLSACEDLNASRQSKSNLIPAVLDREDSSLPPLRLIGRGVSSASFDFDDTNMQLSCILLRTITKEVEPKCPVTFVVVDEALDVAFIGDASGMVSTLLPVRYLMEAWSPTTSPNTGRTGAVPTGQYRRGSPILSSSAPRNSSPR